MTDAERENDLRATAEAALPYMAHRLPERLETAIRRYTALKAVTIEAACELHAELLSIRDEASTFSMRLVAQVSVDWTPRQTERDESETA